MQSVKDHYAAHLGPLYSWMAGGVEAALTRGAAELESLRLDPAAGGSHAVDLGTGFGMHAIPLARLGFTVLAIDSDEKLLCELKGHAAELPIRTVPADLLSFRSFLTTGADVILCMGDTLAHLPSAADVEALFETAAAALDGKGVFILSFRDYAVALAGARRWIPVRSDADRILTCFLEYEDAHVVVNDVVHERDGIHWKLRVSTYRKLRLTSDWVCGALARTGFEVQRQAGLGGMVRLVARPAVSG